MYYELTAVYDRQAENGNIKTVKENYVADAESCGTAEERVIKETTEFAWDTIPVVSSVKRADFDTVVFNTKSENVTFWKVKVETLMYDEGTGKEKRIKNCYLVQAQSAVGAKTALDELMASYIFDYKVVGIVETAILDVYGKEAGK